MNKLIKKVNKIVNNNQAIIKIVLLLLLVVSFSVVKSSGNESNLQAMVFAHKYNVFYGGTVTSTAYNSLPNQTDDTPWITAMGTRCREGVVASNFLPLGTKVMIKGFGKRIFVVEDRMHTRFSDRIDVWFRGYSEAVNYGKRDIDFYIVKS
ncbi:MAG: 3D domain-containing protein [Candidatus Margulisbacteria bacterium]|nr:3D domain-containing protein [Candidatus Margulisiibacteriota bacterium]MBU1617317.1 3D domain-containing protein [Candidatus Margulisiibacteriota bacterium]